MWLIHLGSSNDENQIKKLIKFMQSESKFGWNEVGEAPRPK